MSNECRIGNAAALRQRWECFEQVFGEKARASDAAWARMLLPAERLAVVDDLFVNVLAAHVAAGDWQQVDAFAWRETLDERMRQVVAYRQRDEAASGTATVADAG